MKVITETLGARLPCVCRHNRLAARPRGLCAPTVCKQRPHGLPRAVLQSRSGEEEEGGAGDGGADYQLDMMRCLREVNVDNNTVGW